MTETDAMVFVVDDDAPMRESLKNLIRSVRALRLGSGVLAEQAPRRAQLPGARCAAAGTQWA